MDTPPSNETNAQSSGTPEPEVLLQRADDNTVSLNPEPAVTTPLAEAGKKRRNRTYRPSHKATFVAIGVVVVILAINAIVITFVLGNKEKQNDSASGQVTISSEVLSKIGVNKSTIGDTGALLIVDPNAKFNGKLDVAGDLNISGSFKLNSKFTANEANLAILTAGRSSLNELDVNGNSTLTALNLRNTLVVAGPTTLQGPATFNQLLTVNNSLNVAGNVSIGGTLTTASFVARSLVSSGTLIIGGHIITGGLVPSIGAGGSALGSNGTVSISGNDVAGTIAINIGVGATGGTLASIAFRSPYGSTPRVIITSIGVAGNFYLGTTNLGGFTVAVGSGLPPGGYALNFIVMQ